MIFAFLRHYGTNLPTWMTYQGRTSLTKQKFDYFYILDFEATCLENQRIEPQEIIEVPCLALNAKSFEVEETFHSYVRPIVNPVLSPFCTKLTGITQDTVDASPTFPEVFEEWKSFCEKRTNFTFITCGDWDLKTILVNQCFVNGLNVPSYARSWINIKVSYNRATGIFPRRMDHILTGLNLDFQGRKHSGYDDALNLAEAVKALAIQKQFCFDNTTVDGKISTAP